MKGISGLESLSLMAVMLPVLLCCILLIPIFLKERLRKSPSTFHILFVLFGQMQE